MEQFFSIETATRMVSTKPRIQQAVNKLKLLDGITDVAEVQRTDPMSGDDEEIPARPPPRKRALRRGSRGRGKRRKQTES